MSRSFDLALHVGSSLVTLPNTPPTAIGEVMSVTAISATGDATLGFSTVAALAGGAIPTATREGQLIVADAANKWTAGDADAGRY